MLSRNWILGLLLVAIAVTTLVPDNAGAIPAFARRYKISCTTCHAPFPRLTSFGAGWVRAAIKCLVPAFDGLDRV